MSENFNITRDSQGEISFGLNIQGGVKKYNNSFAAGEESWIVLEQDSQENLVDQFAIILPGVGPYFVSSDTNPAIPSTPGAPMQIVDTVQSIAHFSLVGWPNSVAAPTEKRIYVRSSVIQNITILIYKRGV